MVGLRFVGAFPLSLLDRLALFGVGVVVLGVAAPEFLPGLLTEVNSGSGSVTESAPKPAAPSDGQAANGYSRQVALSADEYGNYSANATINDISLTVVVDTGASTVALTAETAARLGIQPPLSDYIIPVSTANGMTTAAPVVINRIRIGSIDVYNVDATVMRHGALSVDLLGMSFLNKLSRFQAGGGQLVLMQ